MFPTDTFFADNIIVSTSGGIDTYTKLMLHMDDASLIDSETVPKTTTLAGSITRSATQSKFGGFSASFNGSSQYITLADSADWAFGTGDFTIDFWMFVNSFASADYQYVLTQYAGVGTRAITFTLGNGVAWNVLQFNYSTDGSAVNQVGSDSSAISTSTWYHVAVVRNGTSLTFYLNGTAQGSATTEAGSIFNSDQLLTIGQRSDIIASRYFNGYLDEVRVSKGIARWTTTFVPPTSAYTT